MVPNCPIFQCKSEGDKEFVLKPRLADIDRLFDGSTVEGIFEKLEKDGSEWATAQLNTLRKMVSWTECKIYMYEYLSTLKLGWTHLAHI